MDTSNLGLGIIIFVISVIANGILNIQSRGKTGWGGSGGFVVFCMILFSTTLFFGYRLYGWLGGIGAFIAQAIGMFIVILILDKRMSAK